MPHDVFISHSAKDKVAADMTCAVLEQNGLRCWIAPRDILPGADWVRSILDGIRHSKVMVLVFSSEANTAEHVQREVAQAVRYTIPIVPVRIEAIEPTEKMEYYLSTLHWLDAFTPPLEEHLKRLAQTLRVMLEMPQSAASLPTGPAVVSLQLELDHAGRFSQSQLRQPEVRPATAAKPQRPPPAHPAQRAGPKPGDTWTNSIGMKFASIPAGEFLMGSPKEEEGRDDSESQHRVRISKPFMLGVFPVTQAQWRAVISNDPCSFKGDNLPVEQVSWDDAVAFCKKLSAKEGKQYRLPTEAQWEYACRAGTRTAYYSGADRSVLSTVGWHIGNSDNKTHPVGEKKGNTWGLFDMHGNVWEWCSDWYGEYPKAEVADPKGAESGSSRVLRGGSWDGDPRYCRAAYRHGCSPGSRSSGFGFRLALDLPLPTTDAGHAAQQDVCTFKELPIAITVAESTKTPPLLPLQQDSPKSGDIWTNSIGVKFAYIPAGEFLMGSPKNEKGRSSDETQHRVRISKPFMLSVFPVTQALWRAVIGNDPSHFKGDNLPVEQVSWDDAVTFCEKLSEKDGKGYRLPTEAQWEYACRAGSTTPFHFGPSISIDQANYNGNYIYGSGRQGIFRARTTTVGSFPPNGCSLYDMHGNVWEWCSDWYGEYPETDVSDPTGPESGRSRVLRGGSWNSNPRHCRSAARDVEVPEGRNNYVGFRLVLDFQ